MNSGSMSLKNSPPFFKKIVSMRGGGGKFLHNKGAFHKSEKTFYKCVVIFYMY